MITQLNRLCRSINLADGIALLGSLDFVLGSVDLGTPPDLRAKAKAVAKVKVVVKAKVAADVNKVKVAVDVAEVTFDLNMRSILTAVVKVIIKFFLFVCFIFINWVSGCSYVLVFIFITWMFLFIIWLMITDNKISSIYNDFCVCCMVFGYKYVCGWYVYNIFMIYFVMFISWFLT